MAGMYGPPLPPSLDSEQDDGATHAPKTSDNPRQIVGPSRPPKDYNSGSNDSEGITHRTKSQQEYLGSSDSSEDSESESESQHKKHKGESSDVKADFIGPVVPTGVKIASSESESSSEDDTYGPKPSTGDEPEGLTAAQEFALRSHKMKQKLLGEDKDKAPVREEWMTSLPSCMLKAGVNLQARTFRTDKGGANLGDQSVWTDTPADRDRKEQEMRDGKGQKEERTQHVESAREKEMAEQVARLNKKRKASLLDMHQEKLHGKKSKKKKDKKKKHKKEERKSKDKEKEKKKKKEKEKEKEKPERRAFDRDLDLKVNKFDDAMRKAYIKKASGLGGTFGHGGQKFL